MALLKKVSKLKFFKVSPFLEGKNLSNSKDIKPLRKKKRIGVVCYTVYDVVFKGEVFEVKCQVKSDKHNGVAEYPYSIKQKRR